MSARDFHHDTVRNALIKDGWTITHDPLKLVYGERRLYVDLGAERLFAAEKDEQKIAVEIKGFSGASDMADLERAIGQYIVYYNVLTQVESDRPLYLAIPEEALYIFEEPLGQLLITENRVQLIIFSSETEEILRWIP